MKKLLTLSLMVSAMVASAQMNISRWDLRIGFGSTFTGSGDFTIPTIDNEVNYRFNQYFSASANLRFGRAGDLKDRNDMISFWTGGATVFVSPFKNTSRMDLRVGGGVSYLDQGWVSPTSIQGQIGSPDYDIDYSFYHDHGFYPNIAVDLSYQLSDRFLIGLHTLALSNMQYSATLKFGVFL